MQFEIIVGTMLGASEYVADALTETLQQQGHQVNIHLQADIDQLNRDAIWILCSSTHGAGDLPDNIVTFNEQLTQADLSQLGYLVIGLGDTSYDTFCQAAKTLDTNMRAANAKPLAEPYLIDVLNHPIPEDTAVEWINQWLVDVN